MSTGILVGIFNVVCILVLMLNKGVDKMKFPLKGKYVIMVAPSFVVNFSYPSLVSRLRKLGFDKVVELTFAAKLVNREYHNKLKGAKKMWISSTCPGIVSTVESRYPQYKSNLLKIDSPMVAMGKICRKYFPRHKIVFLSPCNFKKVEAEKTDFVDFVVDFNELEKLFVIHGIKKSILKRRVKFDKFYNDYTKVYPLSGALAKTAYIDDVLNEDKFVSIDGVQEVIKFLERPSKKIKFLDCLFCNGGCIGGPHTRHDLSIKKKTKKIMKYLKRARKEDIPEDRKGLLRKARGLKFSEG